MAITEKDVFEAADQLLEKGERPTIERVRQHLGRGSPNTVNRMLDVWWASLTDRLKQKGRPSSLPPALEKACESLFVAIRTEAQEQGGVVLKEGLAELETRRTSLENDRNQLESEKSAIAETVTALRQDLTAMNAANTAAVKAQARLEADLATERGKSAQAIKAAQTATDEREKAEKRLTADLERLRGQFDASQSQWLTEVDRLRQETKELKAAGVAQAKAAQAKIDGAEAKARELEKAFATQRELTTKEREARIAAEARLGTTSTSSGIKSRLKRRSPEKLRSRR